MSGRTPLVVILGATACGKSKLAIDLAQKFCGEIISADSMQVYKGLDIVTNKVTEEEQRQAKHHMIDFLEPPNRYSVIDFRDKSLEIISDLHRNQKLPIIVGGTNYYIESLLWKSFTLESTFKLPLKRPYEDDDKEYDQTTLFDSEARYLDSTANVSELHTEEDLADDDKFFGKRIYHNSFANIASEKLWSILRRVDPQMAHRYHPHDKRKIIRMLQVIQSNNREKNFSDIINSKNKSDEDKTSLGGPLRFKETCVIWLNCDNEILDKKMDERVDLMLERGLLEELNAFHSEYNKKRLKDNERPNYTDGVFQSIGFKEFHDYLMLEKAVKTSEDGRALLKHSVNRMKISTRQYARRQLKWIRRRLLQSADLRHLPNLFEIKTTFDETQWNEQVRNPAISIVDKLTSGQDYDAEALLYKREPTKQEARYEGAYLHCDVCDRVIIGNLQVDSHLKSRTHKKNAMKAKAINS